MAREERLHVDGQLAADKPGFYRVDVSHLDPGAKLTVCLPCSCKYDATYPSGRIVKTILLHGSGKCTQCVPPQPTASAPPPTSVAIEAAAAAMAAAANGSRARPVPEAHEPSTPAMGAAPVAIAAAVAGDRSDPDLMQDPSSPYPPPMRMNGASEQPHADDASMRTAAAPQRRPRPEHGRMAAQAERMDGAWWLDLWKGADIVVFNMLGHHLREPASAQR